jgi:hypothetical protein
MTKVEKAKNTPAISADPRAEIQVRARSRLSVIGVSGCCAIVANGQRERTYAEMRAGFFESSYQR